MIVFDVDKDIDSVMQEILNFKVYPKKIEDVDKVLIYSNTNKVVKAKIFISTFFINFENNVIHNIDRKNHTLKWYLDKSKENYFAKMQGYWKLKKIDDSTRVFYYNELVFKSWVPDFIESYLLKEGLFRSTQWLKNRQSKQ